MNTNALRWESLTLFGIFGLALVLVTSGCGDGPSAGASAKAPESTSPATTAQAGGENPLAEGGMDSGGGEAYRQGNESQNGAVTTTLGDYVVGARSEAPISHTFQEAQPGAPEALFVSHYLETASGQVVTFRFPYSEGTSTFEIPDGNGYVSIVKNGEELVSRTGTVTIEPKGSDAIKVSFDRLTVGPQTLDPSPVELIGGGVIEGPLRRVCTRASDVAQPEGELPPTPPAGHDAAWIAQFCGS